MEFINSTALIWLAAIAIPILLHLFQKEKPTKTDIPTLHFIELALKKTSTTRKLNSSLLLLLRILLIALCIFFIAQPYFNRVNSTSEDQLSHIIIADNSYYTTQSNQLENMRSQLHDFVNSLPKGQEILILTDEAQNQEFSPIKEDVKNQIDLLYPTNQIINFHQLIARAKQLADKKNCQFHFFTDFNKAAWKNNFELDESVQFHPIQKRQYNSFIQSVEVLSNKALIRDLPIQFRVHVNGDRPLSGLKLKLRVGKTIITTKRFPAKSLNQAFIDFHFTHSSNSNSLTFELDSDDKLTIDNNWFFAINSTLKTRLLILSDTENKNLPLKHIISYALGSQRFETSIQDYSYLESHDLSEPQIIIITGGLDIGSQSWIKIQNLAAQGKKIMLWPEHARSIDKWQHEVNALLGFLPILTEYNQAQTLQLNSTRASAKFNAQFDTELLSPMLTSSIQLQNIDSPLALTASKNCALVHDSAATLLFSGIMMNDKLLNSNFLAPLINLFVDLTLDHKQAVYNIYSKQSIDLILDTETKINLPDGTNELISANNSGISSFNNTSQLGFYSIGQSLYAINLQRDKALLTYLNQDEINSLMAQNSALIEQSNFSIQASTLALILVLLIMILNLYELSLANPSESTDA
jgi:hypothetical protein